jgi:hypothetical protein
LRDLLSELRQPEAGGDRERMEEDVVGLKLKHPVAHRFGELQILGIGSSSRLAAKSARYKLTPVALPPGRLRLPTKPAEEWRRQ